MMLIRRVLRIVTPAASATYLVGTLWSHTQAYDSFGGSGLSETEAYLQFPLDLPAGTVLTSATLELTPQDSIAGTADVSVSTIALYSGDLSVDRHDVSGVSLPVDWSAGAWTADTRGASTRIAITALVQAVIDREAFASGDLVTLAISATGETTRPFWSYDGAPNKAPTLALVYDDGAEPFAPAADVLSMCRAMGEQIAYVPSHGDSRTIWAIVERNPRVFINGFDGVHAPGLTVIVPNHPTNGVSSAEVDTSLDLIVLPPRVGRAEETRSINGLSYHDSGALELELA